MRRIRKFLQLSWAERLLLLRTFCVLVFITLRLRTVPWRTLQGRLLELAEQHAAGEPAQRLPAQRIAWAVHVASRCVPEATCLSQALAAQFLLTRHSYPVRLQIGVARNQNGKFEAHAWVTNESSTLVGSVNDLDRFVPLSPRKRANVEDYVKAV